MRIWIELGGREGEFLRRGLKEFLAGEKGLADTILVYGREEEVLSEVREGRNVLTVSPSYREDLVDAEARKSGVFVLGPLSPVFSLWQTIATSREVEVFSGRIPLHESYWASFLPVEPFESFIRRFLEPAYARIDGRLVGIASGSRKRKVSIRAGRRYELVAINYPLASKYFLYKKAFTRAEFWLLGTKKIGEEVDIILRYGLAEKPDLLARRFRNGLEDDAILTVVRSGDEEWLIELRYSYSENVSAHAVGLLEIIKLVLDRFEGGRSGIVWPISLLGDDESFQKLVASLKLWKAYISYSRCVVSVL